ncbi:MAG: DUF4136 domain-containing protein [Sphingomonadales bacterium]|jgi:hypothetical protein
MIRTLLLSAALALLPVAAEAATIKVEVTRFHVLGPANSLAGNSITVVPADPAAQTELQFGALAGITTAELAKAGFKLATGAGSDLVARVTLSGSSQVVQKRAPFSIGIGGATGGWRGGVGGGLSFPLGGGTRTVTSAEMLLQIRKASDGTALWEGRASTISPGADPISAAPALLQALLQGFPGPTGQTQSVKVKTNP